MNVTIEKSVAAGTVTAPPSKSLAHRYIICAALSNGKSVISNIDFSEDIKATLDCIKALGVKVSATSDSVTIESDGAAAIMEYASAQTDGIKFICRESGSTMRFFMGISMILNSPCYFYGSDTLRKRPFSIYETICGEQNIDFAREEDHIYVNGILQSGEYKIPGNISSQFVTGLLFVLPLLETDSKIVLTDGVESKSYIDLTLQALKYFGVNVSWESENVLMIPGGQIYKSGDIAVEGDCSNAAFLEAFNTCGGNVKVLGVNPETLQGDRVYLELFASLMKEHAIIDISDCPDLGPILFAVAAANKGGIFTGTKRLKIKESDRGTVMCAELKKFGISTRQEENEIEIYQGMLKKPAEVLDGHNDHRIVMSEAYLSSVVGGNIAGSEAVRKSYPGFFEDIISLGVEVQRDGMDK